MIAARVGVVIPVLGDDAALARLLSRLTALDPALEEIIVVDGAASGKTAALCRSHGAKWLPASAGRGGQLVAGAAQARADVLWFLHADCEPQPHSVAAIRESIERGAVGGYFRFRFAGASSPLKRFLERCIAWRCRVAMVYGDQGLFVTREAYDAGPGFLVQPLFEEVALVRVLKRTGRFVALDVPILVSPRRWEREGFLRRTLHNRMLALGFVCGITPAALARRYGYRTSGASPRDHTTGRDGHDEKQRAPGDG